MLAMQSMIKATMNLRWVDKEVDDGPGKGWTIKRVLQQEFEVWEFNREHLRHHRRMEWRDIPVIIT